MSQLKEKITSPPKEELSNTNANRVKSKRREKIPVLPLTKRFQIKEYYQRQSNFMKINSQRVTLILNTYALPINRVSKHIKQN